MITDSFFPFLFFLRGWEKGKRRGGREGEREKTEKKTLGERRKEREKFGREWCAAEEVLFVGKRKRRSKIISVRI